MLFGGSGAAALNFVRKWALRARFRAKLACVARFRPGTPKADFVATENTGDTNSCPSQGLKRRFLDEISDGSLGLWTPVRHSQRGWARKARRARHQSSRGFGQSRAWCNEMWLVSTEREVGFDRSRAPDDRPAWAHISARPPGLCVCKRCARESDCCAYVSRARSRLGVHRRETAGSPSAPRALHGSVTGLDLASVPRLAVSGEEVPWRLAGIWQSQQQLVQVIAQQQQEFTNAQQEKRFAHAIQAGHKRARCVRGGGGQGEHFLSNKSGATLVMWAGEVDGRCSDDRGQENG